MPKFIVPLDKFFYHQSRLKLCLIYIGLILVQGIIKTVFPAFPFVEAASAEGGAVLGYITGRSVDKKYRITECESGKELIPNV